MIATVIADSGCAFSLEKLVDSPTCGKKALGLVRALIFDVLSDRRTHNKRFSFRVHANILPGHARAAPEARAARAERAQRSIAESKTARHAREARALRASRTESAARAA